MPTRSTRAGDIRRRYIPLILGVLLTGWAGAALPASSDAAWDALAQPGAIVLFRHANAPGVGDPPGMRIGQCASQRNLDEAGRQQARRLGEQFRQRGVRVDAVLTSQWCRARQTAEFAFAMQSASGVRDEPAFNSWFGGHGDATRQTAAAQALLARWRGPGVLVVVAHQVNLTALTGVVPASAEGLVVRAVAGEAMLQVVGRLPAPVIAP